jgi:GGDEF domain-containing protein
MAGSLSDITDRRAAELQLQHDALHDGLTGLPN